MLSVEKMTTVAEHQALLKKLYAEQDDQSFRVMQLSRQLKTNTATADDLAGDLLENEAEINMLTNQIAVMPAGDRKEVLSIELDQAGVTKKILLKKQKSRGSVSILERQLELEMTNAQLAVLKTAITEVEDHQKTV